MAFGDSCDRVTWNISSTSIKKSIEGSPSPASKKASKTTSLLLGVGVTSSPGIRVLIPGTSFSLTASSTDFAEQVDRPRMNVCFSGFFDGGRSSRGSLGQEPSGAPAIAAAAEAAQACYCAKVIVVAGTFALVLAIDEVLKDPTRVNDRWGHKGYRDASCLFVEMLLNKKDKASSSQHIEYTKRDYCLCLAIHAPRKGIIEIWQMRTGSRLLAVPCPKGSRILQPSTRFTSSPFSSSYSPLEVYLFNGDSGQLSVLNRHIG
ncbi:hypothetical protein GUJ93_ZPchr0002g23624 [Zizania palustris]|uniref:Rab3-GAP regulatory subunit N-terminal domain-containing protein n=1 Tax=Zizania palustris TaxID=103762 RepID=A0A8J5S659_ZIZPA|nr:hypothetical protein GUJ93_ZPchr0002g23624 [Zizania palustris]